MGLSSSRKISGLYPERDGLFGVYEKGGKSGHVASIARPQGTMGGGLNT